MSLINPEEMLLPWSPVEYESFARATRTGRIWSRVSLTRSHSARLDCMV